VNMTERPPAHETSGAAADRQGDARRAIARGYHPGLAAPQLLTLTRGPACKLLPLAVRPARKLVALTLGLALLLLLGLFVDLAVQAAHGTAQQGHPEQQEEDGQQ